MSQGLLNKLSQKKEREFFSCATIQVQIRYSSDQAFSAATWERDEQPATLRVIRHTYMYFPNSGYAGGFSWRAVGVGGGARWGGGRGI